jgi:hypothetical protein
MVSLIVLLCVMIGNTWASYETPEPTEPIPSNTAPSTNAAPVGMENFLSANNLTEADYPAWLLRELDMEAENASFILNYPMHYGIVHAVDMSGTDATQLPMLIQWDDRWGYNDYAGEILGISGAAPTCMSMVAYYLTGDVSATPAYFATYATNNGHTLERGGTDPSLFTQGAVQYGLKVTEVPNVKGAVEQYLKAGIPVVVQVTKGAFTDTGSYIVLYGMDGENILLRDPNSIDNSEASHSWDSIVSCGLTYWAIQK